MLPQQAILLRSGLKTIKMFDGKNPTDIIIKHIYVGDFIYASNTKPTVEDGLGLEIMYEGSREDIPLTLVDFRLPDDFREFDEVKLRRERKKRLTVLKKELKGLPNISDGKIWIYYVGFNF